MPWLTLHTSTHPWNTVIERKLLPIEQKDFCCYVILESSSLTSGWLKQSELPQCFYYYFRNHTFSCVRVCQMAPQRIVSSFTSRYLSMSAMARTCNSSRYFIFHESWLIMRKKLLKLFYSCSRLDAMSAAWTAGLFFASLVFRIINNTVEFEFCLHLSNEYFLFVYISLSFYSSDLSDAPRLERTLEYFMHFLWCKKNKITVNMKIL